MNYGHGDDLFKYDIDFKANFSSNVWYEGTPLPLLSFIKNRLPHIENYPAPCSEQLVEKIKGHHELKSNTIIITNGATEAFYLISNAFHSQTVTIATPTFSEYEQAAKVNQLTLNFIERKSITTHPFSTNLAFICNPNNPDGYCNQPDEIAEVLKQHPHTYFIIDEAYIDFTNTINSCIPLLKKFENLIIIKSLTKLFGIPGLRLGYILGNEKIIKHFLNYKMPWNVNSIAIDAGSYIFDNYNHIYPNVKKVLVIAQKLQLDINLISGFDVISSTTNYFLVRLDKPYAGKLKKYLIDHHQILVRDASNFRGLDNHYIRIASQTPEKNNLLLKALKQWK